jgi:hypothetical protein
VQECSGSEILHMDRMAHLYARFPLVSLHGFSLSWSCSTPVLFHTLSILRFALAESKLGNKHVWTTSLARYTPQWSATGNRNSEFLQFEKL